MGVLLLKSLGGVMENSKRTKGERVKLVYYFYKFDIQSIDCLCFKAL